MIKKLSKHGNSLAFVIEKPILQLLCMDENTEIKVQIEGCKLILEALDAKSIISKNAKIQEAFEEVMEKYAEDLKKLANN
jgi:antitoxin component of MazEF toxin-antitoxin module